MSYARFGWGGSNVYVFMHVGGHLECCMCFLDDHQDEGSFQAGGTQAMIDHLMRHKMAGHTVPPNVFDDLWLDNEKNFGNLNNA